MLMATRGSGRSLCGGILAIYALNENFMYSPSFYRKLLLPLLLLFFHCLNVHCFVGVTIRTSKRGSSNLNHHEMQRQMAMSSAGFNQCCSIMQQDRIRSLLVCFTCFLEKCVLNTPLFTMAWLMKFQLKMKHTFIYRTRLVHHQGTSYSSNTT